MAQIIITGRAALLCLAFVVTVSCHRTKERIVLLPDENKVQGSVAINQDGRVTVLDTPMTAARVNTRGRVEKEAIAKAEVEKDFAAALAALPPEPMSFTLYFEEGNTVLLEQSKNTLVELFAEVARRQAVEVQVTGHTDTLGKESDNDRLSEERAKSIKEMLIAQGLKSNFIRAVGRGSRELLVPTPPNVREPRNRRVEVIVR